MAFLDDGLEHVDAGTVAARACGGALDGLYEGALPPSDRGASDVVAYRVRCLRRDPGQCGVISSDLRKERRMNTQTNHSMGEGGAHLARPDPLARGGPPTPGAYEPPRLARVGSLRDLLAGSSGTIADGNSGQFRDVGRAPGGPG
jgi:hypothetical protein